MLAQVKEAKDYLARSHILDYFVICLRFAIVVKSLLFHPLGDVDHPNYQVVNWTPGATKHQTYYLPTGLC